MKTCKQCKIMQPETIEFFSISAKGKNGFNSKCRPCEREYHKAKYVPTIPRADKGYKVCRKCKKTKLETNDFFAPSFSGKNGFYARCTICVKSDNISKYIRKRPIPKEGYKICTQCKEEKTSTLEFFHKFKRGKDGLNPVCKTCAHQKQKNWIKTNPEKIKESRRKTAIKRKDKIRVYALQRYYNKLKKDPFYRARRNIYKRQKEILGNKQYSRTIGCTGAELRRHLESQFQPGMNWENYGKWHIDHIFPLSVAFARGPESFKKACHYTNLQPLWAIDNVRKGNKIF